MTNKLTIFVILAALMTAGCTASDTVKIGFMGPLTGDLSNYGTPVQKAVQMAVDEVNQEGGINGQQIEMVYEDTKCQGKEGVTAVNKLVNVDNVKVIVGPLCSSVSTPTHTIAEEANTLMISYASSSPELTDDTPLFFRTFPSDLLQAKKGSEITLQEGYERIAVLYRNDEYGSNFKDAYVRNIEDADKTIVSEESYEIGDTDMRTQLQKIEQSNPDFLYLISSSDAAGLIVKQAQELGLEVPMLGSEAIRDEQFIEIGGEATEGFRVTYPRGGEGSEAYSEYVNAYKERYGDDPAAFSAEAYDAFNLYVKAMKECGTTTEQIKTCLESVENYEGASGTITFDENGDVQKEYDVYTVQNGEFVK